MNSQRKAFVYVSDIFAGILEENDAGYSFSYDEKYLRSDNPQPVSLTLPLSDKSYFSKILFPFFDGLIPEGWMLEAVSRNWKIDIKDRFGLLLISCKDAIGSVSIEEKKL